MSRPENPTAETNGPTARVREAAALGACARPPSRAVGRPRGDPRRPSGRRRRCVLGSGIQHWHAASKEVAARLIHAAIEPDQLPGQRLEYNGGRSEEWMGGHKGPPREGVPDEEV